MKALREPPKQEDSIDLPYCKLKRTSESDEINEYLKPVERV